ncbi:MAG: hypothetical protein JWM68_1487 [Verrucomicrobiales bacterium]|nr:hypothetical protein [Verrucomicrobiales bacterium]
MFGLRATAGTFFDDFNSGPPPNASTFGSAKVDAAGGFNGSGVLKLTVARADQIGSFVVDPLDGTKRVSSFLATFKAYIGGGGGTSADGFAFHFAPNIPDAPFSEIAGSGLTLIFDTFQNGTEIAPGISMQFPKSPRLEVPAPNLRSGHFVDALVKLDPDGTLDVFYDNEPIFSNVRTTLTNRAGRFAFGARTGMFFDNHFIDDLRIVTQTSPGAFVDTFAPIGNEASPLASIDVVVRDFKTKVKPGSLQLTVDHVPVKAEVTNTPDGTTLVHYEPTQAFEAATRHEVTLQFVDTGKPAITNDFSYAFRVTSQITISK